MCYQLIYVCSNRPGINSKGLLYSDTRVHTVRVYHLSVFKGRMWDIQETKNEYKASFSDQQYQSTLGNKNIMYALHFERIVHLVLLHRSMWLYESMDLYLESIHLLNKPCGSFFPLLSKRENINTP